MTEAFDAYRATYGDVVQSSIDFTGLPHAFFMAAKADQLTRIVKARLGTAHVPRALDVGCGLGFLHPLLRPLVGQLSATDRSTACIEEARRSNPWVDYRAHGSSELPYERHAFDLTLTICVLHHVPPSDWSGFMNELRRVTRPGGLVCVIEHNPFNPLTRLAVARCEFDRDAVLVRSTRIEQLMLSAGLRAVDSRFFLLFPTRSQLARKVERAAEHFPLGAQYLTCGQA